MIHRCCGDALTLTAVAGTDLTNTDAGFEAVLTPQAPPLPLPPPVAVVTADGGGGGGARRGLQKAMLAAVSSLDGVGKNLSLESALPYRPVKLGADLATHVAEMDRSLGRNLVSICAFKVVPSGGGRRAMSNPCAVTAQAPIAWQTTVPSLKPVWSRGRKRECGACCARNPGA